MSCRCRSLSHALQVPYMLLRPSSMNVYPPDKVMGGHCKKNHAAFDLLLWYRYVTATNVMQHASSRALTELLRKGAAGHSSQASCSDQPVHVTNALHFGCCCCCCCWWLGTRLAWYLNLRKIPVATVWARGPAVPQILWSQPSPSGLGVWQPDESRRQRAKEVQGSPLSVSPWGPHQRPCSSVTAGSPLMMTLELSET